ncbi:MAG: hypothetical protein A2020_12370 [Lentisphaerae bacterium GWF2_45_14]|nr:MAG: hypothetical protein A2020_12370 [Lentisphaerae bacterium GWF2_45_14]
MQIDSKIRNALQKAVDSTGSILQFSKKIRVAHTTVRDWLRGKTQKITPNTWVQVEPFLRPYLQEAKQAFRYGKEDENNDREFNRTEYCGAEVKTIDDEINRLHSQIKREFKGKHVDLQYLEEQLFDKLVDQFDARKKAFLRRLAELETGQPSSFVGAEGTGKEPRTAAEGIENDPSLTPREKKAMLLRLRELELDRQFGIDGDSNENNPTSGAVAG